VPRRVADSIAGVFFVVENWFCGGKKPVLLKARLRVSAIRVFSVENWFFERAKNRF